MSNSKVRPALLASVRCRPQRRHSKNASIVPNANSPASARRRAPSTASKIQAIFGAEKYASNNNPVFAAIFSGKFPSFFANSAHFSAVRRSCQTIALCTALPLSRSHTTVVSR